MNTKQYSTFEYCLLGLLINNINNIYGVGKSGFNYWGVSGFVPVLPLFYVNVSGMRPPFDDTGSLGSPPHQVVYHPGFMVPP